MTAVAKKAVAIIAAAYPGMSSKAEIEQWAVLALAVVEPYSDEILTALADPRRGIVSQSEWLPSIAALKKWCEAKAGELATEARARLPKPVSVHEAFDEAHKDRMRAKFQALIRDLQSENPTKPKAGPKIDFSAPVELSPAALKTVGVE